MSYHYQKKFLDEQTLHEMLSLRRDGWTLKSLALFYGVDHSSIYHLCKKYGVQKGDETLSFSVIPIVNFIIQVVRKPITYQDFLNQEKKRRKERYPNIHGREKALQ